MPWKDSGLWQSLIGTLGIWREDAFLAMSAGIAVMFGLLAKIAAEVESGHRRRFVTKRLWLDIPALIAMTSIAAGISVYFDLDGWPSSAVGVICGWLGPRSIDFLLIAVAERVRGRKS